MLDLVTGAASSLILSLVLTPVFAAWFRRAQLGQFYRADTPTTHVVKRGTPSMGGVVFLLCTVAGYLVGHLVSSEPLTVSGLLVLGFMLGMGGIGFADDYLKVRHNNSLGLRASYKLIGCAVVSIVFGVLALTYHNPAGQTPASTAVSFIRDLPLDPVALFGTAVGSAVFIAWVLLIGTSVSNAVNLVDGLDGLAAGASICTGSGYVLICYWQSAQSCLNLDLAPENRPGCYTVTNPGDLAVAAACLVGALIGFLWWNTHPAQIFMGDTGSFGIGGAFAALAILSRTELLLVLTGGLCLLVTGQVIVQRIYFKATKGKRIWRASPLHHHFEMKGWAEVTIVFRFWIIASICSIAAVVLVYLEWLSRVS